MAYSILIVDQRPRAVAQLAQRLEGAGYVVAMATTDLLIAAERLGLYNGLHLVLHARFDHPEMAAILTAERDDPVLQAEAMSCGAACTAGSVSAPELLALVSRAFASRLPKPLDLS